MTERELWNKYFYYSEKSKSKGANKGRKVTYRPELRDGADYFAFVRELAKINPVSAGRIYCNIERDDMLNDRWWDTPNYRAEAIKNYRGRINAIREQYGMSRAQVKEFHSIA